MKRIYASDFFLKVNECSELACFGVGKIFQEAKYFLESYGLLDKVKYCIDNNTVKQGTVVELSGRMVPIVSLDEYAKICTDNSFLIITCAKICQIINQIESYAKFRDLSYCCFNVIIGVMSEHDAMKKKLPENIRISKKPLIPKKIHYCWFGNNPIPDKYKKWMESWHKYCSDYEIIEWNESNYDVTKNPYMKRAYENRKWGFVPDYARLDIIYNYGGIYLDTDVELIANFDDLLYQKGFMGFEKNKYINLGLGFGGVQGLKILKDMMEVYNEISFVNDDNSLNLKASPSYSTDVLRGKGLKLNGEYQIVEDLTIFPEKTFSGKSISTRRIRLTDYSKSIHHYDGSWVSKEEKEQIEFYKNYIREELED